MRKFAITFFVHSISDKKRYFAFKTIPIFAKSIKVFFKNYLNLKEWF